MHKKNVFAAGKKLGESDRVLIMLHGRGAGADDIISLAGYLDVKEYSILAPQATGNTWYPYSFLAPHEANEPWLSSAIQLVGDVVQQTLDAGVSESHIYFLGFSQGACLTLEYVARNAKRYGGVVAFTGGLIGDSLDVANYKGDFDSAPVFIGTSDPDPHVPVERVKESTNLLKTMNANVTEKIYKGMGHTISEDEINTVNSIIFGAA